LIKGIISLITSGIIFNPMVLLGVIIGFYAMGTMSVEEIKQIFMQPLIYGILLIISFLFTCIFKREYYSGARRVNWKATLGGVFGQFFRCLFAIAMSCLFVLAFDYGTSDETIEKVKNSKNVRILTNEARSATEAPKLPGEIDY